MYRHLHYNYNGQFPDVHNNTDLKGTLPFNGQKPPAQLVCYREVPLYITKSKKVLIKKTKKCRVDACKSKGTRWDDACKSKGTRWKKVKEQEG